MNMINQNTTEQAYRATLIFSIQNLKEDAISLGFDFPTNPNYDTASTKELQVFQFELLNYIYTHI